MNLDRTIHNGGDDPTNETYGALQRAYQFFNAELFDDALPGALLTMQRRRSSRGFFSISQFGHRRGDQIVVDEIALNPATFIERTDREIISTAVHEMAHQWQYRFGKPGRRGYHNKEWAAKMLEVGLIPSHTGEPGGKQTGRRVSHFIEDGGPFDRAWRDLESTGFKLDYQDQIAARPIEPRKIKVRYACPDCSIHVWGKPELQIACLRCNQVLI
jgi:predicted SprT family Zn-dependent metalloprotease